MYCMLTPNLVAIEARVFWSCRNKLRENSIHYWSTHRGDPQWPPPQMCNYWCARQLCKSFKIYFHHWCQKPTIFHDSMCSASQILLPRKEAGTTLLYKYILILGVVLKIWSKVMSIGVTWKSDCTVINVLVSFSCDKGFTNPSSVREMKRIGGVRWCWSIEACKECNRQNQYWMNESLESL